MWISYFGVSLIPQTCGQQASVNPRRAGVTGGVPVRYQVKFFYKAGIFAMKSISDAKEGYLKDIATDDETIPQQMDTLRQRGRFVVSLRQDEDLWSLICVMYLELRALDHLSSIK
jgi:hypothetical protein